MTTDMSGEAPRPVSWAASLIPSGMPHGHERPIEPIDSTPIMFAQHVDGAWLSWSVVEVDARAVPGALGARCLIFTRPDCIRRVWNYPANWRTLDNAGLGALSWRR
jgi:hypothetical protein